MLKYETYKQDDIFHSKLLKDNVIISSGECISKKKAEQCVSRNALIHFNVIT